MEYQEEYFAAANGYGGFRSYFDTLFDPERHEGTFILKGGPGCGKSSLCQKIAGKLAERGAAVDAVHCSSDPDSLDGIVARAGGRSVAVLDGTAPHTKDPLYPGAADSIVDLGAAFRSDKLRGVRDTVTRLGKAKAASYRKAYEYLSLSGIFDAKIRAEYNSAIKVEGVGEWVSSLGEIGFAERSRRLLSAVSKEGHKRYFDPRGAARRYVLTGDTEECRAVIRAFSEALPDADAVYDSPLTADTPEAIRIGSTVIDTTGDGASLPARDFLSGTLSEDAARRVRTLSLYRESLLEEAVSYFADASRHHFALEAIYTPATDFRVVAAIGDELFAKCEKLLFSDKNPPIAPSRP